jgi:hypothetical protein
VQVVVKAEELIQAILVLSYETMVELVVGVAIIVFAAFCLLFLLVVLLLLVSKGLMETIILVILLLQLTVETVRHRRSMGRPVGPLEVRAENELSLTRQR